MRYAQSNTSIGGWLFVLVVKSCIFVLICILLFGCSSRTAPKKEVSYDIVNAIACNTIPEAEEMLGMVKINVYQAVKIPQTPTSCRYISGIVVVHESVTYNGLLSVWLGSDGSKWILFRVTVYNKAGVFKNIFLTFTNFRPIGRLV